MKISIIIPSLPGYENLNDSAIEGFEDTKSLDVELEILLEEHDAPFGVNVNRGLRKAKGEIIVVSNNDVTPLPCWDSWIISQAENGVVSFTPRPDCGWLWGTSREIQESIGEFDEKLVNSYEDYDYFIRAHLLGYPRILADRPYALHQGGFTLNKVWKDDSVRLKQCFKNREYMQKKWPGLDIDLVPSSYFSSHGVSIMREWERKSLGVL